MQSEHRAPIIGGASNRPADRKPPDARECPTGQPQAHHPDPDRQDPCRGRRDRSRVRSWFSRNPRLGRPRPGGGQPRTADGERSHEGARPLGCDLHLRRRRGCRQRPRLGLLHPGSGGWRCGRGDRGGSGLDRRRQQRPGEGQRQPDPGRAGRQQASRPAQRAAPPAWKGNLRLAGERHRLRGRDRRVPARAPVRTGSGCGPQLLRLAAPAG